MTSGLSRGSTSSVKWLGKGGSGGGGKHVFTYYTGGKYLTSDILDRNGSRFAYDFRFEIFAKVPAIMVPQLYSRRNF